MKKLKNYLLLVLAVATLIDVPAAQAQSRRDYWRGDSGRSRQTWNHGMRSRYRFDRPGYGARCEQEQGSPAKAACEEGKAWGEKIARAIGRPLGRHNGYLISFGFGLDQGRLAGSGMRSDLEEGRNSVSRSSLQDIIKENANAFEAQAGKEGNAQGKSTAITRFTEVVDTGRPVNDDYNPIPENNFKAEPNAAGRLIPPPSDEEILKNEFSRWDRYSLYDGPGSDWDREVYSIIGNRYRFRSYYDWDDLLAAIEEAKSSDWFGPSRADTIWSSFYDSSARRRSSWSQMQANDSNSWYNYNASNGFDARFYNSDGKGIIGNPDLPLTFKNALMAEYREEVVDYYRDAFYNALDDGSYRGYNIGYYLGREKTYYAGQAEEFNYEFRSQAEKSFAKGWQNGYIYGFDSLVQDYSSRPVVSVAVTAIKSADTRVDGNIEPGEPVYATFKVTNIGRVASNLTGVFDGALTSPVNAFEGTAPRISASASRTFQTAVGNVADVRPGNLNFSVGVVVVDDNNRKIADSIGQSISYQVVLATIEKSFSVVQGRGQVVPKIQNVTTLDSSEGVTVTVQVGNQAPQVLNLGAVAAGRTEAPAIGITVADPLELIGKTLPVSVTVNLGQKLIGQETFTIGQANGLEGLVEYMDALADKNSGVGFPGDYNTQLQKTVGLVLEEVKKEVAEFGKKKNWIFEGHNPWESALKDINKMIQKGEKVSVLGLLRKKLTDNGFPATKKAGYKVLGTSAAALAPSITASGKKKEFTKLTKILIDGQEK